MTLNRLSLALLAVFASCHAVAEDFVVRDIRVEGIQRTEAGTVFSYLPVKVGDTLTEDKAAAAIKALYATGFFKDVRLESRDDVLIVVVEERPSISRVTITGIKEFSEDDLKTGLKQTGLAEGRVLDRALLDKAEQELRRQYFNRGKYAVEIKSTLTPLERNRVDVQFDVVEGDSSKIRRINIVGHQSFKEKELLRQFSSTTPGWFTWYTKNDQYSKTKLAGDIENLRSFYLNRGYLEFNVESTQVSISPDKKDIYITVNISEGRQYRVSDVKLAGQILLPEEELMALVSVKPGEVFVRDRLTESTKKIGDLLGNEGYAFANVNAVPELDKEKSEVAFTLFIDPGRRVYVKRINIAGNTKTRDEVVRREVRQMEGAWYDAAKINRSRERINRLGFFNEVNIETPSVSGTTDQVDVNISVDEKSTGSIMVGAGYSSTEGVVLSGSVSQANLFGTGNRLTAQINTSSINTIYSLSYTNPYFTINGVSIGYDIYRRDVDSTDLDNTGFFQNSTLGAGVRFGLPINERDFISMGLAYEQNSVKVDETSPNEWQDFVEEFGEDNDTVRLDGSWSRDSRDNFLFTTRGVYQRIFLELGVPPGSLQYYKLSLQHQQYFDFGRDFVLMLNGEIGYGGGLNDKPLPFFKNFYAGGTSTVRGFKTATLGPKDNEGDALGGDQRYIANAELYFPVPGLTDDKSLRFSTFIDGGAAFGPGDYLGRFETFAFDDLRWSAGVALLWVSPLGPLKFSLATPLVSKTGDEEEMFQFSLGNVF
jgi:outer membrane protein insertion porin family